MFKNNKKINRNILEVGVGALLTGGLIINLMKARKIEKKTANSFLLQSDVNKDLLEEIYSNRDEIITLYDHLDYLVKKRDLEE